MWITFLGAAGTVTGSRFLVEHAGSRVLVDCGLFQGDRALRRRNWEPFPVPADRIDAVVLTHAHLDHSGYLPRLVQEGFNGPILCSTWTARLAPIVLRDAAHLQEEDAEHNNRVGASRHHPALPLFDAAAAEKAIALLHSVPVDERFDITADIAVRLRRAGHILGSTTAQLTAGGASVTFSGDLGRTGHPLLRPPDSPLTSDAFVVESTYGDRTHPPANLNWLAHLIGGTLERRGVVLVPAFAVDRTPVLLMILKELFRTGLVPPVPVYVDSPMALAALDVYREAVRDAAPEIRADQTTDDPFDPGTLRLVPDVEQSKRLNHPSHPCIVLSASGMATGGRVVHHLAALAPDPRNLILLPGFQVAGTRGRALQDGARTIKIFGSYVPVRARVATLDEYSAHADADQVLHWLSSVAEPPRTCFVVHGEPAAAGRLADRIDTELGWSAVVPRLNERVRIVAGEGPSALPLPAGSGSHSTHGPTDAGRTTDRRG